MASLNRSPWRGCSHISQKLLDCKVLQCFMLMLAITAAAAQQPLEGDGSIGISFPPTFFTRGPDAAFTLPIRPASIAPQAMDPIYQELVDLHNGYRKEHQAGNLVWDDYLAQEAEKWAKACTWAHFTNGYGQNLFAESGRSGQFATELQQAVRDWYNESTLYDFNNPGFSSDTGHFTQVVWKATTKIGCYIHTCTPINGIDWTSGDIVVCNYLPPGNYLGEFEANVLPKAAASPSPQPASPSPQPRASPSPEPQPSPSPDPTEIPPASPLPDNSTSSPSPAPLPSPSPQPPLEDASIMHAYDSVKSPGCLWSIDRSWKLCVASSNGELLVWNWRRVKQGIEWHWKWVMAWRNNVMDVRSPKQPPYTATLGSDGRITVRDSKGRALLLRTPAIKPAGKGPYILRLRNDGKAAIYGKGNTCVWSTAIVCPTWGS